MGRSARGVRGMRLASGQSVIALIVVGEGTILTVTENGYGKRTETAEYSRIGRGGQGVISIQTSNRFARCSLILMEPYLIRRPTWSVP